jgi:ubiquinone/menaquinone biosynthesis C-methylase UbiE
MSWIEFWDTQSTIYVNDRHKAIHYQQIADEIAAMVPGPGAHVLDVGCGEAQSASRLADACGLLVLSDAAPAISSALRQRYGGHTKIRVLSPAEVAQSEPASFDLIVVNSMVQYVKRDQLLVLLAQWRGLLAPRGTLVLGDILPHQLSAVDDAAALLRFAAAHGFVLAASVGLVKTLFSDYRKKRAELGLLRFDEAEILAALSSAGFEGQRLPANLGHNQNRMTFKATLADDGLSGSMRCPTRAQSAN